MRIMGSRDLSLVLNECKNVLQTIWGHAEAKRPFSGGEI